MTDEPKRRGRPPKSASNLTGHCMMEKAVTDGLIASTTSPEEFHLHCPGQMDRPDTPTGIPQSPYVCSCPQHRKETNVPA